MPPPGGYFFFAAFLTVFFAAGFAAFFAAVFFAAGFLTAVFFATVATVVFRFGCGFDTCFTALFAARSTAATALLTDWTASFAAFLTFFSIGPCGGLLLGLRLLAHVPGVRALVGLDVLELAALVADGVQLGAGAASHGGASRGHASSCLDCGAPALMRAVHL